MLKYLNNWFGDFARDPELGQDMLARPKRRGDYWPKDVGGVSPLEKMFKLIQTLRPFEVVPPDRWLIYEPRSDLPGYPRFDIISIDLEPPQYPIGCNVLLTREYSQAKPKRLSEETWRVF